MSAPDRESLAAAERIIRDPKTDPTDLVGAIEDALYDMEVVDILDVVSADTRQRIADVLADAAAEAARDINAIARILC